MQLQQHFRRTYADLAPAKKPRRFRYFTYLWRLTYLSTIGGAAYLAYGVYDLRHPDDQFESDPSKKNLVILGEEPIFYVTGVGTKVYNACEALEWIFARRSSTI